MQCTDLGITEIASKIGELWRGLSEAEKGKYKAKAEKLKEAAAKAQVVCLTWSFYYEILFF